MCANRFGIISVEEAAEMARTDYDWLISLISKNFLSLSDRNFFSPKNVHFPNPHVLPRVTFSAKVDPFTNVLGQVVGLASSIWTCLRQDSVVSANPATSLWSMTVACASKANCSSWTVVLKNPWFRFVSFPPPTAVLQSLISGLSWVAGFGLWFHLRFLKG